MRYARRIGIWYQRRDQHSQGTDKVIRVALAQCDGGKVRGTIISIKDRRVVVCKKSCPFEQLLLISRCSNFDGILDDISR